MNLVHKLVRADGTTQFLERHQSLEESAALLGNPGISYLSFRNPRWFFHVAMVADGKSKGLAFNLTATELMDTASSADRVVRVYGDAVVSMCKLEETEEV